MLRQVHQEIEARREVTRFEVLEMADLDPEGLGERGLCFALRLPKPFELRADVASSALRCL